MKKLIFALCTLALLAACNNADGYDENFRPAPKKRAPEYLLQNQSDSTEDSYDTTKNWLREVTKK